MQELPLCLQCVIDMENTCLTCLHWNRTHDREYGMCMMPHNNRIVKASGCGLKTKAEFGCNQHTLSPKRNISKQIEDAKNKLDDHGIENIIGRI
jgi:hypothetical protein